MRKQSFTTGFVTSRDGTAIGYRTIGSGPPLILLHGGMQAAQNFTSLAIELSDSFTVHVPDRRGRGLSGPYGDGYNLNKECEDIAALLRSTSAKSVFGLSSGAIVALQSALNLSSIQKIALYEPPLSIDHSSPTSWVTRFDREVAEGRLGAAFITVMKGLDASPIFRFVPRFVLEPIFKLVLKNEDLKEGDVPISMLIPTMHYDVQLVLETEGLLPIFGSVKAETLLLGGGRSQAFLRLALDALSTTLARSHRITFSALDHMGPDNSGKPARVAEELRRFFS